jgi:hypothetical protein
MTVIKHEIFKDIWKTVVYINDIVNILFEYYIYETINKSTSHD